MNTFFELLQVAIGVKDSLSHIPQSRDEWEDLLKVCGKHSLVAITFPVIDKLHDCVEVPLGVYSRWAMMAERVKQKNVRMNDACKYLYSRFAEYGFRSCVLKGQSVAALYPMPELRQSGDIDIWVEGGYKKVMGFLKGHFDVNKVVYHHCDAHILKGINVEVHFMPSWMNSRCADRRLQKYFEAMAPEQFEHYIESLGFCAPTRRFDAVYHLIHIYRHLLDEGIGLRQMLDYYYVLNSLTCDERQVAWIDINRLGLAHFAAGVMSVLKDVLSLDESLMLCAPDVKQGEFLLEEIMISGNFGRYDKRNTHDANETRIMHAKRKMTRSMRYLAFYPGEVLSIPIFMVFHYFWRLFNGYLK